jgi:hypothetical protein
MLQPIGRSALLLALSAFVLVAFAHLTLTVFLLLLTAALAGTVATLLAALIAVLVVLVRHHSLLFTLFRKAAIERL